MVLEQNLETMELHEKQQEPIKSTINKRINELDLKTVGFLTFLYILQGIPVGTSTAIPLILGSQKATYSHQGIYSFTRWPFFLRILWAPIVERFYCAKIGRRKTWIFVCQFLSGFLMLLTANLVNETISSQNQNKEIDIFVLTGIFGFLVVLSATNDITLDAWSIGLLPEKSVGLQSLCNTVGMSIGMFIGGSGFLMFESAEFSNRIRLFFTLSHQPHGLLSIQKLFYIMGTVLVITSILVLKFKQESYHDQSDQSSMEEDQNGARISVHLPNNFSILDSYKLVWRILFIRPVRIWIILMISHRFAFSVESSFNIKLVEKGVAREKLSLIGAIMSPILSWLPIVLIDLINRSKPLDLFKKFFVLKMISIASFGIFVFFFDHFVVNGEHFSITFYAILAFWKLVDGFLSSATSISLGSFNAQISDRLIGAIYMTFLSFWPNLGANLSRTSMLFLINLITINKCQSIERLEKLELASNETTSGTESHDGQKCQPLFDPIYPLTIFLCLFAVAWLLLSRKHFRNIQKLPKSQWEVKSDL